MTDRTSWLQEVRQALARRDAGRVSALLQDRPVEDLVELVEQLHQHGPQVLASVAPEEAADVLEEIDEDTAHDLLRRLAPEDAAEVFDELEDDRASSLVREMEPHAAAQLLDDVPPEDAADVLEILPADTARNVLAAMPSEAAADVLEEMGDEAASEILEGMDTDEAADLLEQLDPHDAVDLLQEMDPEVAQATLAEMEPEERSGVVELLAYPEDTAGGQMTKRYFAMRPNLTAAGAIESLRRWNEEHGTVYYGYVVDDDRRLIGVVPLHRLVVAAPETPIREIMTVDPVAVRVGADQEELAQLFRKYRYVALPVVDDDYRLLGIVSVDDALEVIDDEATEDAHRMVGLPQDERVFAPVLRSVRRRVPWLYVNLGTALLAAWVVDCFENTIAKVTALAVMMPIVAGQGGNTGTQTLTIIVRGLALGEVDRRGAWRALWKEVRVGVCLGLIVGIGVGIIGWIWQDNVALGIIIGVAMLLNMTAATIAGVVVPLGLRLFGVDPALASAIFVTTVTDCAGFFFFLGLATLFLKYIRP